MIDTFHVAEFVYRSFLSVVYRVIKNFEVEYILIFERRIVVRVFRVDIS